MKVSGLETVFGHYCLYLSRNSNLTILWFLHAILYSYNTDDASIVPSKHRFI